MEDPTPDTPNFKVEATGFVNNTILVVLSRPAPKNIDAKNMSNKKTTLTLEG